MCTCRRLYFPPTKKTKQYSNQLQFSDSSKRKFSKFLRFFSFFPMQSSKKRKVICSTQRNCAFDSWLCGFTLQLPRWRTNTYKWIASVFCLISRVEPWRRRKRKSICSDNNRRVEQTLFISIIWFINEMSTFPVVMPVNYSCFMAFSHAQPRQCWRQITTQTTFYAIVLPKQRKNFHFLEFLICCFLCIGSSIGHKWIGWSENLV